jgi:VCBS repeat-containing protein
MSILRVEASAFSRAGRSAKSAMTGKRVREEKRMNHGSVELGKKRTQKGRGRMAGNWTSYRSTVSTLIIFMVILAGLLSIAPNVSADSLQIASYGVGCEYADGHTTTATATSPCPGGTTVAIDVFVKVAYQGSPYPNAHVIVGVTTPDGAISTAADVTSQVTPSTPGNFYFHWGASTPCNPATCVPLQPGVFTVNIQAVAQACPGPCPDPGTAQTSFSVVYAGPAFDFNLALSPSTITVKQGDIATYQVSITYSDPSYSGTTINVQLSGLGPGMDYHLTPYPPTLSISTSQSTPTGTYTIILVGSAKGVTHEASGTLVVQPAQQFDFSLSASPPQQSVSPGGSTTYTITVSLVAGTAQNVALTVSGASDGVTASLNPMSGTASFSSTLSITTTASAAPGQYVLTITGTAGVLTHATTVTLAVAQSPDFTVDVSPPSQAVLQGQAASFSVSVTGLNGFSSQVSLTVTGVPSGVTSTFTVPSSTPDYSSTLTLSIAGNAPTGSFTLTITGSGGGLTRVANVILTVNPSQSETTTTQTAPLETGGLMALTQDSLIIIAVLVLLVILLAALAMKGRGRRALPQQVGQSRVFCGKCGAENPASNEFCVSCGNKLRSS